ncbi:hypothetical protein CT0861_05061 [Colletotrichum tofieldiae]|uniref:HTH CENPB-type domain-containing protein n=1 Tax=Colletotrichum tofieldiae TaxID=708197 RepID=A0A166MD72_9PEZI|nr:hypothetical protein CT0861_05061 [Colletotrichum tofieldiae]
MDSLWNESITLPPLRSSSQFNRLSIQQICNETPNVTRPPNVNHQNLPNTRLQRDQEVETKNMHHLQHLHSHGSQVTSPLPQSQQKGMLPVGEQHVIYPITQAYKPTLMGAHSHPKGQLRGRETDEPIIVSLQPPAGVPPSAPMSYDEISLQYRALIAEIYHSRDGPSRREQKLASRQAAPRGIYDEHLSQRYSPLESGNTPQPTYASLIPSTSSGNTAISRPLSDLHTSTKHSEGTKESMSKMRRLPKGAQPGIPMTKTTHSSQTTRAFQGRLRSTPGRIFKPEEEESIVKWVKALHELKLTPNRREVKGLAKRVVHHKDYDGKLGNNWLAFFLDRHPSLPSLSEDLSEEDKAFDESSFERDDDTQGHF